MILYHGTPIIGAILTDRIDGNRVIRASKFGDKHVSFTSDYEVAKYFAEMDRDFEFYQPAILKVEVNPQYISNFKKFKSEAACFDEKEYAFTSDRDDCAFIFGLHGHVSVKKLFDEPKLLYVACDEYKRRIEHSPAVKASLDCLMR